MNTLANEAKKNAYLERHLECIRKDGLQTVDLDKLLGILEISRGSFYNYFHTKKDYIIDLVAYIKGQIYDEINTKYNVQTENTVENLKEQLLFKFSLEMQYDVEKIMTFLQLSNQKDGAAYRDKIKELNEIDIQWIATRFSLIFHVDLVYCKEGALLFLSMIHRLLQLNTEATVKSATVHLVGQCLAYAEMICKHNSTQKITLFFKNQQDVEAALEWDKMMSLLMTTSTVTSENQPIVEALIEELNRQEKRMKIIEVLIQGIDDTNDQLKEQLLMVHGILAGNGTSN